MSSSSAPSSTRPSPSAAASSSCVEGSQVSAGAARRVPRGASSAATRRRVAHGGGGAARARRCARPSHLVAVGQLRAYVVAKLIVEVVCHRCCCWHRQARPTPARSPRLEPCSGELRTQEHNVVAGSRVAARRSGLRSPGAAFDLRCGALRAGFGERFASGQAARMTGRWAGAGHLLPRRMRRAVCALRCPCAR